jgi:hypothetical protein
MSTCTRNHAVLGTVATIAACLASLCAAAAQAETVTPLPPSDYSIEPICGEPGPGEVGCLSLKLVPRTAAARARTHPLGRRSAPVRPALSAVQAGNLGYRPLDIHRAYSLPQETAAAESQTIAIVDAYNDPTAEADLQAFDEEFGLPPCTAANGCLRQVNQSGTAALPPPATVAEIEAGLQGTNGERSLAKRWADWGLETSLDVQTAHAVCPQCKILLVEAKTSSYADLEPAERTAAALGATEISNSWGAPEGEETPALEQTSPFNVPGVVITASAGDDGYLGWDAETSPERNTVEFPASSPHVVAIGGTRLQVEPNGSYLSESVWNGSGAGGGGCSKVFTAQAWQQNTFRWHKVGCENKRAVADVSADADPYTGVAVRYSGPKCSYEENKEVRRWCTIGGTSLAAPLIAAVYALAGGAKEAAYPARTLYQNSVASPGSLHDVTVGSNGACYSRFQLGTGLSTCSFAEEATSCAGKRICLAAVGYDGPTGLGTPNGIDGFVRTEEDTSPAIEKVDLQKKEREKVEEEEEERAQAGGTGGPGSGPGGGPTETPGPAPGTTQPPGETTTTTPGPVTVATIAKVEVSGLTFTRNALIALNRVRPRLSSVGFAFTINVATTVRATLARHTRSHGHLVWKTMAHPLTFRATRGRNSHRLSGTERLVSGTYRLTLAPSNGNARSLMFLIG